MATQMPILHLAKTGAPQKGGPFSGESDSVMMMQEATRRS